MQRTCGNRRENPDFKSNTCIVKEEQKNSLHLITVRSPSSGQTDLSGTSHLAMTGGQSPRLRSIWRMFVQVFEATASRASLTWWIEATQASTAMLRANRKGENFWRHGWCSWRCHQLNTHAHRCLVIKCYHLLQRHKVPAGAAVCVTN